MSLGKPNEKKKTMDCRRTPVLHGLFAEEQRERKAIKPVKELKRKTPKNSLLK